MEYLNRFLAVVKKRKARSALIGAVLIAVGSVLTGQMEMVAAMKYLAGIIAAIMGSGV